MPGDCAERMEKCEARFQGGRSRKKSAVSSRCAAAAGGSGGAAGTGVEVVVETSRARDAEARTWNESAGAAAECAP